MKRVVYFNARTPDSDWYDLVGFPPEKLKMSDHVKGNGRFCPALKEIFKNIYVIRSPFDLYLRHNFQQNGESWIEVLPKSTLSPDKFNDIFHVSSKEDLNHKDRPMIQMTIPILFLSDSDIQMDIIPPFLEYNEIPGIIAGGSFNIHDWQRPINMMFEWHDTSKDLIIKRGDPILYLKFTNQRRDSSISLEIIEPTDKIKKMVNECTGAKAMTKGLSSTLMKEHGKRRPKRLIKSHIRYVLDRFI